MTFIINCSILYYINNKLEEKKMGRTFHVTEDYDFDLTENLFDEEENFETNEIFMEIAKEIIDKNKQLKVAG